jgi:tripartite-type tricarboxylate transporter receptor subunit TctC
MRKWILPSVLAAGLSLALAGAAHAAPADDYPNKPITIVVPYSAGGGVDTVVRLIAPPLSERLGKTIIIENRPGVSGMVGAQLASRAAPDGYTLLAGNLTTNVTNPFLVKNLSYRPAQDFIPVAELNSFPTVLVVPANSRFQSVQDVIAALKAAPDSLAYGSAGVGSAQHLAAGLFQSATKTRMRHIPYKGSSNVITDLIGGQIDLAFEVSPVLAPFISSGRLRALGVTSKEPLASLPGVKPIAELGVPGFEMSYWNGLFVPTGTPPAIVQRLGTEVAAIMATEPMQKKMLEMNMVPGHTHNAAFAAQQEADTKKWGALIKEAGIEPD